jgi:predicted ATPase
MVEAGVDTHEISYRLLDTTRAYALEKLLQSGEHDALATRHAKFLSKLLEETADAERTDREILAQSRHTAVKVQPEYVKRTTKQIAAGTGKRRAAQTKCGHLSE